MTNLPRLIKGAVVISLWLAGSPVLSTSLSQDPFPDPPTDITRIYFLNGDKQLSALPFESGSVPLNVFAPAVNDRITRVQLKGATAETVLDGDNLRFYVFVADKMDPPPHQLVRLDVAKAKRELRISVIKGRKGYAPFAEDSITLERRLLKRLRMSAGVNRFIFVNYMQLSPIKSLPPGEYAIIGDSLADMATFRIK